MFEKPLSPAMIAWRERQKAKHLAAHLAYLARPRKQQHKWTDHHGRGPARSKRTMAKIEAEHRRLCDRWHSEHPGEEMSATKVRSLWANAVCCVTYRARQRNSQRQKSHIKLRYHYASQQVRAEMEAAGVNTCAPPPAKRARWSLPGV